jgi:hypothetical protein
LPIGIRSVAAPWPRPSDSESDKPEAKPARARRTEAEITVREATHHQIAWSERSRGAAGAFTIQLILDRGVDEYVIRPTAEEIEVLADLLGSGAAIYFDTDRKVFMFGNQASGG